MSPPELLPQNPAMHLPLRLNHHHPALPNSCVTAWPALHANSMPYPSPVTLQDNSFDFGFGSEILDQMSGHDTPTIDPVVDYLQDAFVVTPEDYQEPLATPKGISHQQKDPTTALPSPGFSMLSYPGSRRPSATDELSANFGEVALAGTSPNFAMAERGIPENDSAFTEWAA